jgi:hypothetical protein
MADTARTTGPDTATPPPAPPPPLTDALPVLLGPVRVEYRFTATELLVRVFPDDWQVDNFEPKRTAQESDHALRYWLSYWEAGGDPAERLAAWRVLASHAGPGRARYIVRTRRPLNPGDEPHRAQAGQVILVVATDDPIPAGDRAAATTYWRAVYRSGGAAAAVHTADQALNSAIGTARAAKVRAHPPAHLDRDPRAGDRAHADVTVAFCDLPKVAAADTKPSTWTQPALAQLLPDAFTLFGYVNGQLALNVTGSPVPTDLAVGPDPGTPDSDQFQSQNGLLHVPAALKWLFDFDTAVSSGMGFRVPLTDAIRGGLDRLIVLGLRNRAPATSKQDLEQLIQHQADDRAGFRLLPQGTATNNTGKTPSAFGSGDDEAETFSAQLRPAQAAAAPLPPPAAAAPRPDGQWLAELLGIDPAVTADLPGSGGTDQNEARAMNTALWPATWGYFLGTMLNPIFGTGAIDATRAFFTRFVSGRGPVPAFRVGQQPYGVLVTTAFSRLAWADTDPAGPHRRALNAALTAMAGDWASLAADVPHLGATGDPHATLLGILGLHPTSAEYYQRNAQSAEDYFNRQNLGGFGDSVLEVLNQLGLRPSLRTLLSRLGYPDGGPDPDLASRLFTGRQQAMKGPLIDDRPLSEDAPIRAYTDGGANYLEWLADNGQAAFDTVRQEAGFTGGTPPTALLYLLARHAVLAGYFEAALRLAAAADSLTDQDVVAERREPPFVHVSLRTTATESRFGRLYAPDPAVTGDPAMLVVDYIQAHLGQQPATQQLAEQLSDLATLAQAPTARLERVLAEHLDTCAYRLDAWRLGLASEKLFGLRYPAAAPAPVTGVHLGAFGYLEEVRPRATQPVPVTLTGELAQVFTPPGAPPLVHDPASQGFIHAPSMPQATTSALLRAGYLANATPDNPGTLAVNLSSERVRTALTFIDGIRAGQSLGALLGYRLELGLHDRHDIAETDQFISALRQAFPLVANKLPDTADPGQPIDALEARNVVDGLALIRQVTRTGPVSYPFGIGGLPDATPVQAAAISFEVGQLIEINDSLADLSVAEGVYQTVAGNPQRAKSAMDAYTTTANPPDPAVIRTPRAGQRLNHRVSVNLRDGLPPKASPAPGVPMTPRGNGDPAVDQWLAGLLPDPGDVAVQVGWTDPVTLAQHSTVVTQADAGLQPIDLLWALRPADQVAMTDLDDRIAGRAVHTQNLRGDTEIVIRYTTRITGKITFFELSPLVDALRQLLLAARPVKPSDYIVPADGATLDPDRDAAVDLPRNRPQAVRDALTLFSTALASFGHDLGQPLADPVAHRQQLLSGVDTFLTRYADLLTTASSCGLVRSGWGEMMLWRRRRFGEVLAAVQQTADRMAASLAAASAKISAYDALPASTPADSRFALLQQAERLLTTKPTSPRPATPQQLRAIVGQRRTAFTTALAGLTAIGHTTRGTISGLLADVQARLPLTQFDAAGLDLTAVQDTIVAFCQDLLTRAQNLLDELTARITAVDAALAQYDAATAGPDRVTAATAAIRAGLGPDALATSEFGISKDLGQTWQKVLQASQQGKLTAHLTRDFPVDDWLHGLARVRPRLALWERITLLSGAIGQHEPDLIPVQFPFTAGDPWLGLEIPPGFSPGGDRLLHTTHYAAPFNPGDEQCALLLDEWTETIPATTLSTGIAAHYDRPGTQPPQTMLLVAPPVATGAWRVDDLVAAISETFALAQIRAVEPGQLDPTPYAQLLPATVLPAGAQPISIATDLSINNDLTLSAGPFRPARG